MADVAKVVEVVEVVAEKVAEIKGDTKETPTTEEKSETPGMYTISFKLKRCYILFGFVKICRHFN
jgi:hypothetical protein